MSVFWKIVILYIGGLITLNWVILVFQFITLPIAYIPIIIFKKIFKLDNDDFIVEIPNFFATLFLLLFYNYIFYLFDIKTFWPFAIIAAAILSYISVTSIKYSNKNLLINGTTSAVYFYLIINPINTIFM